MFEKDSYLEKDKIVQQRMALGLLNPPKGSHLAMGEIGNDCFNTLLWNSLLHDVEKDEYENIRHCKMHDLAQHIGEGYCSVAKGGKVKDISNVAHLSWNSDTKGMFQRLQSLHMVDGVIGSILTKFSNLRVLVLYDYDLEELPSSIGKMKHLKYLNTESTGITTLPNSIGKLYNLQTLRVWELKDVKNHLS